MTTTVDEREPDSVQVIRGPRPVFAAAQDWVWPVVRLVVGFVFFWAFLDKLLALGFATGKDPKTGALDRLGPDAWIHGGSPTYGFLKFGTDSPLSPMYESMAGVSVFDWLFMLGMGGVGLAVILGVATRIATVSGILLMVSLRLALLVPENNPIVDEHLVYALLLIGLAALPAARRFSLATWWEGLAVVRRFPILR
ncbi:hypothetical protein PZ938_03260 [Luteipulveratus sp. YIM 133132]|uniref:DoxX family protein n=1 Tax=Luteipulveratus flavus TaxID=3031728 RepID=A0ABT6C1L1_9MICO|nr:MULTISPECIES: hypothetical protein [unclassified Luteipulveratus]MDE9364612.1 hypothetical protein [Luteipulveratus sp. YIM 133132]MDF8262773.1 hypothetical protein [Luteipulveratus sp. YIM 133296]